MRCLITYDIANSRRLQRVQRHRQQYARALQRSVYLFEGTNVALAHCIDGLKQCIDPERDDVRLYAISQAQRLLNAGHALTPEGIWLATGPD